MRRLAFIAAGAGLAAMAAALIYGFAAGNGFAELQVLVGYPWFNVSLVDVYVGFGLFGAWVAQRERSRGRAAAWIVAILVLGNLVSCAYVLLALRHCRGDWNRFWRGDRSGPPATEAKTITTAGSG